jgi:hypothetical protein
MTAQPLPALTSGDPSAWDQALYAFLELRQRLDTPGTASAGRQRARLQTRLEQLRKQHGWGDISNREYQTKRDSVQAALAQLLDGDRIRTFDAYRTRLLALLRLSPRRHSRGGKDSVGSWSNRSW